MSYLTFRVEITRDESRPAGEVTADITAYIDRVPETNEAEFGGLSRAAKGVWNSRLQYTGDFAALGDALAAIEAAFPGLGEIRCFEWTVDDETPVARPPLRKTGGKWLPSEATSS
jgi:hypothetical protein